MSTQDAPVKGLDDYKYGFSYPDKSVFKTTMGLSEDVVRAISAQKQEPEWMLEFRLRFPACLPSQGHAGMGGRHRQH